jgi:hypothetical protein
MTAPSVAGGTVAGRAPTIQVISLVDRGDIRHGRLLVEPTGVGSDPCGADPAAGAELGDGVHHVVGANNSFEANSVLKSGIWNKGGVEDGPQLLEGAQVGTVIYGQDGGANWNLVTAAPIEVAEGKHVQAAYNDRPGSYYEQRRAPPHAPPVPTLSGFRRRRDDF